MDKIKCARCGYSEFNSSLHFHHIDFNHENNVESNIIVLCSNCHFGVHHKKWNQFDLTSIYETTVSCGKQINIHPKNNTKRMLKNNIKDMEEVNKRQELDISTLKNEINKLKKLVKFNKIKYSHYIILDSIKSSIVFNYIHTHGHGLYNDLATLERIFNTIEIKAPGEHGDFFPKTNYPNENMKDVFLKYIEDIKSHRTYLNNILPILFGLGDFDTEWDVDIWELTPIMAKPTN